jgi:hypothetical protein
MFAYTVVFTPKNKMVREKEIFRMREKRLEAAYEQTKMNRQKRERGYGGWPPL